MNNAEVPSAAAENLCVTFRARGGVRHAVCDFSFALSRGCTTAVVGQSGSGKTTLLRALLGLVRPSSGRVTLFGQDVNALPAAELARTRRRCGYVPQDPYGALPPGLTALEAVVEPAVIARRPWSGEETQERARALLAELGLTEERVLASRAVGLSGGQRQRVELARALMLDPELLLCDEPTSMQDASTRGEIVSVLNRHVARGMSMIFVTHDLRLASRTARTIIVMQNGRLCEAGTAEQVLNAPTHPYTRELIAALPVLPPRDGSE